jgi:hypothetical protein
LDSQKKPGAQGPTTRDPSQKDPPGQGRSQVLPAGHALPGPHLPPVPVADVGAGDVAPPTQNQPASHLPARPAAPAPAAQKPGGTSTQSLSAWAAETLLKVPAGHGCEFAAVDDAGQ